VTPEEHVLSRAVAPRLHHREILYVTLRNTFGAGRQGGP